MDRFGSSRLRMVWTLASLLLAGLAFGSTQGFSHEGTQLVLFGTSLPIGAGAAHIVQENLSQLIHTAVPAILVLGGFIPLGEWVASNAKGDRIQGLFLGTFLAFLHGIFLSQVALLPIFGAGLRIFGGSGGLAGAWGRLFQADLNGVVLGLQLLLWTSALSLIVSSNKGLAVLGAFGLAAVGESLVALGQWGSDLALPGFLVKTAHLLGQVLPARSLPSEAISWTRLPLAIGAPLILGFILSLLPTGGGKSTGRNPKPARAASRKKAKA